MTIEYQSQLPWVTWTVDRTDRGQRANAAASSDPPDGAMPFVWEYQPVPFPPQQHPHSCGILPTDLALGCDAT
jgi:hypothetical protein